MNKKALIWLAALFLLAGCSLHKTSPQGTKPPTAPPTAPLTLTVDPANAAPGQSVALTLRAEQPGLVQANSPAQNGVIIVQTCFNGCKTGRWTAVELAPVGSDGTLYTGKFAIPLFLPDSAGSPMPLASGKYELTMACLANTAKGCIDQPDVSAAIQVAALSPAVSWVDLPRGTASPLPVLGGFSATAVDPGDPRHTVTCVSNPPDNSDIPRLEVSRDGGKTKGRISLVGSPFKGQHGIAGCRTVALDPQHPDTFYAEDSGNTGGGYSMTQPPYVTTDHGETWERVPMPANLTGDAGWSFRGFSMSRAGVTAWFSTAAFDKPLVASEQIAGHLTTDGGHTWQQVPLPCDSANCLTQVSIGFMRSDNGLIRSADQGKNWDWVRYANAPITAISFHAVGDNGQTLLAVNAAVAKQFMPLLYSADGGQTWRAVQLPGLPGGWVQDPTSPIWDSPNLSLLPDGSLLAHRWSGQPENADWYRLSPGSSQWEKTAPPAGSNP
ncbi:MAG: WD40/YVTN/BNR-like repeat-containing protein [Mycobacterium leprae]